MARQPSALSPPPPAGRRGAEPHPAPWPTWPSPSAPKSSGRPSDPGEPAEILVKKNPERLISSLFTPPKSPPRAPCRAAGNRDGNCATTRRRNELHPRRRRRRAAGDRHRAGNRIPLRRHRPELRGRAAAPAPRHAAPVPCSNRISQGCHQPGSRGDTGMTRTSPKNWVSHLLHRRVPLCFGHVGVDADSIETRWQPRDLEMTLVKHPQVATVTRRGPPRAVPGHP